MLLIIINPYKIIIKIFSSKNYNIKINNNKTLMEEILLIILIKVMNNIIINIKIVSLKTNRISILHLIKEIKNIITINKTLIKINKTLYLEVPIIIINFLIHRNYHKNISIVVVLKDLIIEHHLEKNIKNFKIKNKQDKIFNNHSRLKIQ